MKVARATAIGVAAALASGAGVVGTWAMDVGAAPWSDATAAAVVRIGSGTRGRVVPPSFLGLSIEWDSIVPYTGPAGRRRTDLLRVLAPLRRAAGTPLALRIGGDTADQAWWNPSHRPRPPTVLQDIGPSTLDALGWLARGLGGPVTLGLDLPLHDPANARLLAAEAQRRLPAGRLTALEIGNEPDLYGRGHAYRRGGHLHIRLAKYPGYDTAAYARDAQSYLRVLSRPRGPTLVVGGFASRGWWPSLPGLLRGWGRRPGAVAAHLYAVPQCTTPTPSTTWLTSPAASRGRVARLAPLLAIARRRGLPVRVAELNSAACGGRAHFSETRAAALWLTDSLFAILNAGAQGADVHTWRGARYAPFAVGGAGASARPPLAGMLAFARGAPSGSRLVHVAISHAGGVRGWATVDAAGTRRLVLLAPRSARVQVRSSSAGCASLWQDPAARGAGACACPSRGGYRLSLPARSLTVLTIAGRARGSCRPTRPGPGAA